MNRNEAPITAAVATAVVADLDTALKPPSPQPSRRTGGSATQDECRRLAEWLAIWRNFLAVNEGLLAEAGVTPREFAALLEIDRSEVPHGPTIGILAERLRTRHNTSVGLVTRMCKKGYVRRIRDTQDRRQAHVQLTERGRHVLTALVRAHCLESWAIPTALVPVTAA